MKNNETAVVVVVVVVAVVVVAVVETVGDDVRTLAEETPDGVVDGTIVEVDKTIGDGRMNKALVHKIQVNAPAENPAMVDGVDAAEGRLRVLRRRTRGLSGH